MDSQLITRNESLFFILYTIPTLFFLTISLAEQIKNLTRHPYNLRGLKITMIWLRLFILVMVASIFVYNVLNFVGVAGSAMFLDSLPYAVSTLLLFVSITLWLQWKIYGKDVE